MNGAIPAATDKGEDTVYDLLLKNAHVYGPEDLGITDIGISDGKISRIGSCSGTARRTLDCRNQMVLPGAIETHAHMLLPFGGTRTLNDFYEGTKAGAFGGVTTLIDFADQVRGGSALEAFDTRMKEAEASAVDYSLHCTLTDISEAALDAIPDLIDRGVTSFKFYTAYSDSGLYLEPEAMERAFAAVALHGALATVHCEDEEQILLETNRLIDEGKTAISHFSESRPDQSEEIAIARVIDLARKTGAKLLIRHVSSEAGARLIEEAQKRGQTVIGETCPHYLMFTRDVYTDEEGGLFICNPPIRGEVDRDALWRALKSGVKFLIGTDDCSFCLAQKRVSDKFHEVPGGMPGIETRVPIMLSEGCSRRKIGMEHMVHMLSTDVAKLYGLYPRKGVIAVGSDADLMVVEKTPWVITASQLHGRSDYTPFEGLQVDYGVDKTISRGEIIVEKGNFFGRRGAGRFLKRSLPASLSDLQPAGSWQIC